MRDFDYSSTVDFLAKLYAGTDHAVEIRVFPNSKGDKGGGSVFTRDPQTVQDQCTKWARPGFGTFFGVATRRRGSPTGQRKDIVELPAVWAEVDTEKLGLDKADVARAVLGLPCPPSLIIDSGRGLHFYWMLRESIDVSVDIIGWEETEATIIAVLKQLAGIMAGDTNVCDLARVMRLPGTVNTKDGKERHSGVIGASWARYELGDLIEMLDTQRPVVRRPAAPETADPIETNPFVDAAKRFSFNAPIDVEQRLAAMRYEADGENGVHATQLSVSASLVTQGSDDGDIIEILMNATMAAAGLSGAGWNWRREEQNIVRMIASARAKFGDAAKERQARGPATIHQLPRGGAMPAPAVQETEANPSATDEPATLAGFPLNDLGNAQRLIVQYGPMMRYVVGIGWHVWDGRRFEYDPGEVAARRYAHETARWMMLQAFDRKGRAAKAVKSATSLAKFAITSGNANKIAGMLSSAEPHVAVKADRLDSNMWLLNCLNGTVDLRDGTLRPHAQSDLITKLVPVAYDPSVECPTWQRFLMEIFDKDETMVSFLQRALGYSLCGSTREQVIFIMHGGGANGKSVLLETIAALLSDYASHCPTDTFTSREGGGSGIPNDVARLAGARFVSIVETEHDKKLAEGLVKQATGSDRMTARFLRQEFFEFTPQFKIWLATNHKPRISGTDNAIWRRIRLIPFNVTFVDADGALPGQPIKDLDLKDKLLAELPGILRWMVEGCAAWLEEDGLKPPVAVMTATKEYRESQDIVAGFIDDRCHVDPGIECGSGDLYDAYKKWCIENGERTISSGEFGSSLTEKGYVPRKAQHGKRMRKGLDLRLISTHDDQEEG